MKLKHVLSLGLLLSVFTSYAQISLNGEIRPRTEYRNGFSTPISPAQKHALFTDQRTRLNFGFQNKDVETMISVQDIRVWGNTSQLKRTDGLLSVHQGWAKIPLDSVFSLKLGRQEIAYDDQRFFGSVGWATQARSHDAALLQYQKKSLKADFGLAYNQSAPGNFENLYQTPKNYKSMQYLWLNKEYKTLKVSLLALNSGNQAIQTDSLGAVLDYKTNFMQTFGTRLVKKHKKFTTSLNAYVQTGQTAQWNPNDVFAYLVGVDIEVPIKKEKSKVTLGYELISGTSEIDMANGQNNSFSPLFGTNHKFNGFMDYFYVGNHGNNVGLQDVYVRYNTKIKNVSTGVDVHMFMSAADVQDKEEFLKSGNMTAMNPNLGSEIDLYIKHAINKTVSLKAGYSHFLTTDTLHALKGDDVDEINNWGWVMIIVKPKFK